jgi:hypothetical protein
MRLKEIEIEQEHYSKLEIDIEEKDIVLIWQRGNHEANVIQIERTKLHELIDVLKNEIDK